MSAICGVIDRLGAPYDATTFAAMSAVLDGRGPDGDGCMQEGPAALGQWLIHPSTCPCPSSPVVSPCGRRWITLAGNLDYRGDLASELAWRTPLGETADAQLILAAYDTWGDDCASHLCGAFAFAIWDSEARSTYCARDILGIRPFYYSLTDVRFGFGSETAALLPMPGVDHGLNEAMLGDVISARINSLTDTVYRGIQRLPPAHAMVVSQDACRIWQYWQPDIQRCIRHRDDASYTAEFHALVERALRDSAATDCDLGILLSGGLDSSYLTSCYQKLRGEHPDSLPILRSYSLTFPDEDCDEQRYSDLVAEMWKQAHTRIDFHETPLWDSLAEAATYRDLPSYVDITFFDSATRRATADGVRVMYTGLGGDEWFNGDSYRCADYLLSGRLPTAWGSLRHDSQPGDLIANAWKWGLKPAARRLIPDTLMAALPRRPRTTKPSPILSPGFAQQIGYRSRLRPMGIAAWPTFVQKRMFQTIFSGGGVHHFEQLDRYAGRRGIQFRHPLLHRPIIDFAFALPEDQRWRDGVQRVVMRHAMRGIVPDQIAARQTEAEFSIVARRAAAASKAILGDEPMRIATRGWVDQAQIARMWAAFVQETGSQSHLTYQVQMAIMVEYFLRAIES